MFFQINTITLELLIDRVTVPLKLNYNILRKDHFKMVF